ncbi:hypothetical protein NQD34_009621 [Periophthalmus magnuspinnatus]|nr:hypothetical protein NQD34_009621 [Periophthalmus magnuspinnatus]
MWISNSATTAMMLPIAKAVLDQLSDTEARAEEKEWEMMVVSDGEENSAFQMEDDKTDTDSVLHVQDHGFTKDCCAKEQRLSSGGEQEQKYSDCPKE